MQIIVKTRAGSSIALDVEEVHTIWAVKTQIHRRLSIAPEQQRLFLAGKVMEDTLTLADYKLRSSSLLSMAKSQGAMAKLMMDNRTILLEVSLNSTTGAREEKASLQAMISENVARTTLLAAGQRSSFDLDLRRSVAVRA